MFCFFNISQIQFHHGKKKTYHSGPDLLLFPHKLIHTFDFILNVTITVCGLLRVNSVKQLLEHINSSQVI